LVFVRLLSQGLLRLLVACVEDRGETEAREILSKTDGDRLDFDHCMREAAKLKAGP
jgi:hypothetical protein